MILNRTLGIIRSLAVVVGGVTLLSAKLSAASFTYNSGDLVLAFRQIGGSSDLVVNIGPASFYDGVPTGNSVAITNLLASQLNTAFPGTSLDSIRWTVSGAIRVPGNPTYPIQTIWVTAAREDIDAQTTPWNRQSQFAQGNPASVIAAIGNNAATYSSLQPGGINNTATNVIIPSTDANAYTPLISSGGNLNDTFPGTIENETPEDFDSAGLVSRSDLYKLVPGSGVGQLVGHFDLSPNGTLTFTAGGTVTVSRPTITAIQRAGNVATVSFTTVNSLTYGLYYTSAASLTAPLSSWTLAGSTLVGNGSVRSLQDTSATTNRFYAIGVHP